MPELDRVSYAFGMKVNMGNYESADFHVSLSSDVKAGETQDQAFERVRKAVEEEGEKRFDDLRSLKRGK